MRTILRASVVLAAVALLAIPVSPAMAHETREVGDHEFVVGWYDEPAFAYAKNGPEVIITDAQGDPVEEGVSLSLEMEFEGETATFELEPSFSEPNNYQADLYPTRAGTYTFHITGTVGEQEVDETFTSGPDTFGDIEDPTELAFPVADPSQAELADQVEQLSAGGPAAPEDSTARTIGYVGIALGALALIVAVVATMRRRAA